MRRFALISDFSSPAHPCDFWVLPSELRGGLAAVVAGVTVGAVVEEPLHGGGVALAGEMHQYSALRFITRIDVRTVCEQ